ncbi:MAG: DUF2141 domain-containing protein [Chitinophagaceae bacterium]
MLFILAGIIFGMGTIAFHPATEEGIKINIINLHNNKGFVLVSLFKNGEGYPNDPGKAFRKAKLAIQDKKVTITFPDLPSASYAIAILHDENDDQKMNKNFMGLPKEGYGFSNNAAGVFGPPGYNKASFRHTANTLTTIVIKAKY